MAAEIGVVLAQVGTPESADVAAVRRYLRAFLSDVRMIDLPRWRWWPVLHGAVLPIRPRRVLAHYRRIWTDAGSPLLVTMRSVVAGVQLRLGPRFVVAPGLAYGGPSIGEALAGFAAAGISRVVVLPMFPQFSTSTTAAVYDEVMFQALGRPDRGRLPVKSYAPSLRFVPPFFDDPAYVAVLASSVRRQLATGPEPDRFVFSYHGLPRRFVDEGDPYVEHCEATTRLLIDTLGLPEERCEIAYQSRFGREEWTGPSLQERLPGLAAEGVRRPAIVGPGFTVDCLETLHELDIEGRELFAAGGGDPTGFRVLACLNDDPVWLDYLAATLRSNSAGW